MKGVVVVVNKWDALPKDSTTMTDFTANVREELNFLNYVPVIFISALTGQRIHQVLPTALRVVDARRHHLSTSEVNEVIHAAYDQTSPAAPGASAARLLWRPGRQ